MLHTEEINEYNRFLDLRETWNNILKKSRDDDIFLTWEYLWTWWKHYGKESQLMILLAEEENKIVAMAPLMRAAYRIFGFKLRKIEFIGASKHTDYSNFILTEKERECLKLFITYLNDHSSDWDCIEFRGIPETAESLNSLHMVEKELYTFEERPCNLCPYIPLPNSFEAFYEKLSRSMRKELRRCLRRLREKYEVEFKRYDDIDLLQDGMEAFFALHQKRWRTKGLPGSFADPTFRNFLLDIAECFTKNGWLNLSILTANSKPIASLFSFEYNEKFYFYNSGFDPAYSKYSPCSLLSLRIIEDCIRRGLKEFDFLRGAEAYKTRWNTLDRRIVELSRSKGLLGNLYSQIKKSDSFIARKLKSVHKY